MPERKYTNLKDQILVLAPHEGIVPPEIWLACRKKLMNNTAFSSGRKAKNTWLAGKIKCGCDRALQGDFGEIAAFVIQREQSGS